MKTILFNTRVPTDPDTECCPTGVIPITTELQTLLLKGDRVARQAVAAGAENVTFAYTDIGFYLWQKTEFDVYQIEDWHPTGKKIRTQSSGLRFWGDGTFTPYGYEREIGEEYENVDCINIQDVLGTSTAPAKSEKIVYAYPEIKISTLAATDQAAIERARDLIAEISFGDISIPFSPDSVLIVCAANEETACLVCQETPILIMALE